MTEQWRERMRSLGVPESDWELYWLKHLRNRQMKRERKRRRTARKKAANAN